MLAFRTRPDRRKPAKQLFPPVFREAVRKPRATSPGSFSARGVQEIELTVHHRESLARVEIGRGQGVLSEQSRHSAARLFLCAKFHLPRALQFPVRMLQLRQRPQRASLCPSVRDRRASKKCCGRLGRTFRSARLHTVFFWCDTLAQRPVPANHTGQKYAPR